MLHDWALAEDPPLRRPGDKPMPVTAATVRTIIAAHWLRRDFLGHDAGDPEWSLMLELYSARLEGRQVHQTGLCVAAGVPQSTTVQATRRLIEAGLFATKPDPRDGRKLLVALTAPPPNESAPTSPPPWKSAPRWSEPPVIPAKAGIHAAPEQVPVPDRPQPSLG